MSMLIDEQKTQRNLAKELKTFTGKLGASLVGIADLELLKGIAVIPWDLLESYTRGISIAVRLSNGIVNMISHTDPTELYAYHYRVLNSFLDHLALRVTNYIQEKGYLALPIPASQVLDREKMMGSISHRAVARAAGLGWYGKNMLLITPQLGPRIRLVTVLTNLDLLPDDPIPNQCGACSICLRVCPVNAIKGIYFEDYPKKVEDVFDVYKCAPRLAFFQRQERYGSEVCGLCMKVCPWGSEVKYEE